MFNLKEKYHNWKKRFFYKSFNLVLNVFNTKEAKKYVKYQKDKDIFDYILDGSFKVRNFYFLDYLAIFHVLGAFILTLVFKQASFGLIFAVISYAISFLLFWVSAIYIRILAFFVRRNYKNKHTELNSINELMHLMYPKVTDFSTINKDNQNANEIYYYNHFFKISDLSNLFENILKLLFDLNIKNQSLESKITDLMYLYLDHSFEIHTEEDMKIGKINREFTPFLIKNEISMEILYQILLKIDKASLETKKEVDIIVENTITSYYDEIKKIINQFLQKNKVKNQKETLITDSEIKELIELQQKIFA